MKKITLLLSLIALIFASCQNKDAYTIKGSFLEDTLFNGKKVYLQKIDSLTAQAPTILDSMVIDNKTFTFKGTATGGRSMAFLSVGRLDALEANSPVATIILEPGKIDVSFAANGDVTIGGTEGNNDYNKILLIMNDVAALYKEVSDAGGIQGVPLDSAGNGAETRLMSLQDNMKKAVFDFAKSNMTNQAGQFAFFSSAQSLTREQLAELVEASDSTFKKLPEIEALIEDLSRIIPAEGQPYADIDLVDAKGTRTNLSAYIGNNKCVLIDFWASWCGPCIQEMPALKSLYGKYKNKGFEIVGISVDEDKSAWLEAVKKHGMNWVQLADDKREGSEKYAVSSIPYTVLVDQNGVVLATGLRGEDLEKKIAEILK